METLKAGTTQESSPPPPWFGTRILSKTLPIAYSCHDSYWFSDIPSDQQPQTRPEQHAGEAGGMGLDGSATHLRRIFGSSDGITVSVAPHFATSWTSPYPDFPDFPGPMGVDPVLRAGRLEKPQTALVPSSLPRVCAHMPAREATKDQDGQRLVAHALGQSRSRPRDCFPPSRIKWPDGYSQPAWLSCLMIYYSKEIPKVSIRPSSLPCLGIGVGNLTHRRTKPHDIY